MPIRQELLNAQCKSVFLIHVSLRVQSDGKEHF